MDKAEIAAKRIVETLVRGAKMHYRESQSAGEHDFDLEYAIGVSVPLEVTMSTNEETEAIEAAIMRSRKEGPFVPRIQCQHDWWVHPQSMPESTEFAQMLTAISQLLRLKNGKISTHSSMQRSPLRFTQYFKICR